VAGHKEFCDQAGPAGLVRGTYAATGVAMEVFIEQQVVLEVRVALQLRMVTEDGTRPRLVGQEDPGETTGQFASGDGSRRTAYFFGVGSVTLTMCAPVKRSQVPFGR